MRWSNKPTWKRWFAWHPVQIKPHDSNIVAWLEWVERRENFSGGWEYRLRQGGSDGR